MHIFNNILISGRKFRFYLFLGIGFLVLSFPAWSQTKGIIFDPAEAPGNALLDPNDDGFVSTDNTGFSADDEAESEIAYIAIPTAGTEGDGDVSHGSACSYVDFVNTDDTSPLYFYSDGTYLFFRFRIGGSSNSSKTYSVFIDTDEKYGFSGTNADPNAVTGNPGFEIELSLHTNRGIGIYDVDGNVNPSGNEVGDHSADRPSDVHSQRAVALTEVCGDDDYFYDFFVAFADFGSLLNSSTKMRMVAQSGISANPIIGTTSGTDLGGVDDDSGNGFDLIEDMIDDFPPLSGDDLAGGGPFLHRAACPGINDPIEIGATEVSGTSSEADGATIEVFSDDVSVGTTTVASGIWTLSGLAAFAGGEIITATAEIPGVKSVSVSNCNPVTVDQECSETPIVTAIVSGQKGFSGTSNEEGADIYVWTDADLTIPWNATNVTNPDIVSGGTWQVSVASGGAKLTDGIYYVTAQNTDECKSDPYVECYGSLSSSTTPTISNSPVLTSTTTLEGGSGANARIDLIIDGIYVQNTTSDGVTGEWSFNVTDLEFGQEIVVQAAESGLCPAESSTSIVTEYSIAPLILEEFCAGASGVTEISGISSEPFNSTVTLYSGNSSPVVTGSPVAYGTVDANGNWTISGLNLLAGTYVAVTNTNDTGTTSELESELSNEIQILAQTSDASLDITTQIINEGDASISGEGTNGNTIQLYIDDVAIEGFSTTVSGGVWTIDGMDEATAGFDILYPEGQVGVTSMATGKCESDQVYAIDPIQCRDYAASGIALTSGAIVCINQTISLSFSNSEERVYYQLYTDADATNPTGAELEGTGGNLELVTDPLSSDVTKLYLKAERIGVACDHVFSASFTISVKGTPAITLASNTIGLCDDKISGAIEYTDVANGPLLTYSIDFGTEAEAEGFADIIDAAASSQITFDVPANAPNGSYSGVLTVANSDDGTCVSSNYSFSMKIIENTIDYGTSASPTACEAEDGSIELTGLTPDIFYVIGYDLDGADQTIAAAEADDNGTYRLTNLDEGIYENFVAELSGCQSNTLLDAITLTDPSIASISISDSAEPTNCLNDDGYILVEGLDTETAYDFTYNTYEIPQTISITADANGSYRVTDLPNGVYNNFQVERLNCFSNLLEESITFVCSESLYNTPVVTPNGDGFNDFMEIEGIEDYPNNKVTIFNRWGNLIWEKDGYRNDDTGFGGEGNGRMANGALTDGTYFLIIDKGDGSERQKNFVVIKR